MGNSEEGKIKEVTSVGKVKFEGAELFSYSDEFGVSVWVSPKTGFPVIIAREIDSETLVSTRFDFGKEPKIEIPTKVK